jgi:hypothetical protein
MKRNTWITLSIIGVIITALIVYSSSSSETEKVIETEVEEGSFEIRVTITGELQAKNSVEIMAPQRELREIRVWEISIATLVPEGTVVDSGDVVATLEQTAVMNSLKDIEEEIEKEQGDIEKAKIDSTLELRSQRDQIQNLKFAMDEAQITVDQSIYESPTVQRQAEISLEKAEREYKQAVNAYALKVQQAKVTIRQQSMQLGKKLRRKEQIQNALQLLVIKAPAPGMVIYEKERDGSKRKAGTQMHLWRAPTVATLPDLSILMSKTYVNEIDISKVRQGQPVFIGVDAFPEKEFTGEVTQVANIGEQLPNTDAKVFEVEITMNETDPILRPSMTTSNAIITKTFDNVKYLPLEAVHSDDSLTYVYTKSKTKKLVLLGESNENSIIVEKGLDTGEKVLLSVPEGAEDFKYGSMELAEEIKTRLLEKGNEEEKPKDMADKKRRPRKPQQPMQQ